MAFLAALSLLISVVMVPVSTSAADREPDYLPFFDACPQDIIPGAGFDDVPDLHPNAGDIDCIAYYGITKGTSASRYSPDGPVIREHMALFLVRLAKRVGIDVPSAADTPFEDIGGLNPSSREAISQIYQLGITMGATSTTYAPARNVSRGEMALFLQRLMDRMVPVTDGRTAFGYTPDDVNDNHGRFEVRSPFQDLARVPHDVFDAVTHLYELGVASGESDLAYGPGADMSRAAMAEFMAAILDHSNLRPRGLTVQVTPTRGSDDFEVVTMASVRDQSFAASEDVVVDWFYTDDPDGGLRADGTCNQAKILGDGDCIWDDDEDRPTDLDGNLFGDFDATPGATMSVYAWIGRRDGERYDRDTANFSKAQARSEKSPDSISVQHDAPANAARIRGDGALIVDLDRRSSVVFTIQLLEEDGARLERQGVPIEIGVESRQIRVEAADVIGGRPDPDVVRVGRDAGTDTMVLTDQKGSATFTLRGPRSEERLDTVTIEAECCARQVYQIAWSDGDSVLVAARPDFELYQRRVGDQIVFTIAYDLLNQYGDSLRGTDSRYTGRPNTDLTANLTYQLYHAPTPSSDGPYRVEETSGAFGIPSVTVDRSGVKAKVEIDIPTGYRDGYEYLVKIGVQIFSDRDDDDTLDTGEVRYVNSDLIAWGVKYAREEGDLDELRGRNLVTPSDLSLNEVELYPASRRYRTFFTLWSYDATHKFRANDEFISMERFEELWEQQVDGIEDLDILIYGSGFSLVEIK